MSGSYRKCNPYRDHTHRFILKIKIRIPIFHNHWSTVKSIWFILQNSGFIFHRFKTKEKIVIIMKEYLWGCYRIPHSISEFQHLLERWISLNYTANQDCLLFQHCYLIPLNWLDNFDSIPNFQRVEFYLYALLLYLVPFDHIRHYFRASTRNSRVSQFP